MESEAKKKTIESNAACIKTPVELTVFHNFHMRAYGSDFFIVSFRYHLKTVNQPLFQLAVQSPKRVIHHYLGSLSAGTFTNFLKNQHTNNSTFAKCFNFNTTQAT